MISGLASFCGVYIEDEDEGGFELREKVKYPRSVIFFIGDYSVIPSSLPPLPMGGFFWCTASEDQAFLPRKTEWAPSPGPGSRPHQNSCSQGIVFVPRAKFFLSVLRWIVQRS